MELSLIIAATTDGIIGTETNQCLYSNKDKEHFKMITQFTPSHTSNLLIVGRKTWETLPESICNCKYRKYIVLTKQRDYNCSAPIAHTFDDVLKYCMANKELYYKFFVIGGAEVYKLAMDSGFVTEIYLSEFCANLVEELTDQCGLVKCTIDINKFKIKNRTTITDNMKLVYGELETCSRDVQINLYHYKIVHKPFELQYISLLSDIVNTGVKKQTRNGTTLSITDRQIKINLTDGFPIITVRKSFWRGIKEELLWMMTGSTSAKILQLKNIHIWDGNTTREFLDKVGLYHLSEGDIGAGYGFQMRYTGANYVNCDTDYKGQGIDQLVKCVDQIKNDPNNRRIIINLWNVADLDKMTLSPCHYNYQFTITNGKLSCHLYQRSWDTMLGWNTSTAALLTHILAHYCDLDVGTLTHTICDAHIYECHLDTFNIIKNRIPYKLPKLVITGSKPTNIDGYTCDQFTLVDYLSHDPVKMDMVA